MVCKVRVPQGEEPFFPLAQWTKNYLPVPVRIFAYQLVNNTLPVGARLGARYLNDVNRAIDTNCPFCTSAGYNLPLRETFSHLFLECSLTISLLKKFRDKYWPMVSLDDIKWMIFLCKNTDDKNMNLVDSLIMLLFLFCIWNCRIRKKISFATVENNMEFLFQGILKANKNIKEMANENMSLW